LNTGTKLQKFNIKNTKPYTQVDMILSQFAVPPSVSLRLVLLLTFYHICFPRGFPIRLLYEILVSPSETNVHHIPASSSLVPSKQFHVRL